MATLDSSGGAAAPPRDINDGIKAARNPGPNDPGPPTGSKPFDQAEEQEKVRSDVARRLLWGLLGIVAVYAIISVGSLLSLSDAKSFERVKELYALARDFLGTALASITGLVGAVTGFYFGAQASKKT